MKKRGTQLEAEIGRRLRQSGRTLAAAESCTGGLIGHRITAISGCSDYFIGGVVAYSNRVKERILGVRPKTLAREGAVSAAVARQMALGVLERLGADIGVAVTGVAGPTGGTPRKPVGLVYVCVAGRGGVRPRVRRHRFAGSRRQIKLAASEAALEMVRRFVAE